MTDVSPALRPASVQVLLDGAPIELLSLCRTRFLTSAKQPSPM
ncbi:MAG: hypothetical protein AB7R55_09385 [Gemmatimonadales bacterium]